MSACDPESSRSNLDNLLDLRLPYRTEWKPQELGSIFGAEIDSPVTLESVEDKPGTRSRVEALLIDSGLTGSTLRGVLMHDNPPLELLVLVKQYAKAHAKDETVGLPVEAAAVLYYLAIAVALVTRDKKISSLSDAELRQGLEWAETVTWLEQGFKHIVRLAKDRVSKRED